MRVLIVEDEPVVALEIESIVLERAPEAETVVAFSLREAFEAVSEELSLAFLDIDVTDGQTYSLALELRTRDIPFVFVSAASRGERPVELADAGFIPKPFLPSDIERTMRDFAENRLSGDPPGE